MAGGGGRLMKLTWLATQVAGKRSARLGGAFASQLWFTPWRIQVGDRGLQKRAGWLAPTEELTLDVGPHRLRGFTAGRGPTVLLVHGWGDRAASMGAFIAPLVESGYRVVGLDLPAHGDTSRGRTDIFELAATVRGATAALGDVRAVIAHSMGGTVTSVAIDQGLDIDACVLMAPASDLRHAVERFGVLFSLPDKALHGLRATIERQFGSDLWDRLDLVEFAKHISIPALVVHDEDDPQVDVADSRALIAAWPQARALITSGLGHDKITRDPRVIDHVVSYLIQELRPTQRELVSSSIAQA